MSSTRSAQLDHSSKPQTVCFSISRSSSAPSARWRLRIPASKVDAVARSARSGDPIPANRTLSNPARSNSRSIWPATPKTAFQLRSLRCQAGWTLLQNWATPTPSLGQVFDGAANRYVRATREVPTSWIHRFCSLLWRSSPLTSPQAHFARFDGLGWALARLWDERLC